MIMMIPIMMMMIIMLLGDLYNKTGDTFSLFGNNWWNCRVLVEHHLKFKLGRKRQSSSLKAQCLAMLKPKQNIKSGLFRHQMWKKCGSSFEISQCNRLPTTSLHFPFCKILGKIWKVRFWFPGCLPDWWIWSTVVMVKRWHIWSMTVLVNMVLTANLPAIGAIWKNGTSLPDNSALWVIVYLCFCEKGALVLNSI